MSGAVTSLATLPGLGPQSEAMLQGTGITSLAQLQALGSVQAHVLVKRTGCKPSLNLLWGLEGAITGEPWQLVSRHHRTSLLLALDQAERESGPAP
jgi:DNA transformation protein